MASRSITIDTVAYLLLKEAKKEGESFSQTIKRLLKPRVDYKAWLKQMQKNPLSSEAVQAIEQQVRNRHRRSKRIR
jgi:predicted CopG family antitoxin